MTNHEALTLRYGHRIRLIDRGWPPSDVDDRRIFIVAEVTGHITRPIICTEDDLHFVPHELERVPDDVPW